MYVNPNLQIHPTPLGNHNFVFYICDSISALQKMFICTIFLDTRGLFIYLFLAVLGLRCCTRAFSSCGERGLLFVAVHGLLIAVASLVAEHRL